MFVEKEKLSNTFGRAVVLYFRPDRTDGAHPRVMSLYPWKFNQSVIKNRMVHAEKEIASDVSLVYISAQAQTLAPSALS